MNSSFGIGPSLAQTGLNGPSIFPTTSLAATAHIKAFDQFYFQAGIFNAKAGDGEHPYSTYLQTKFDHGILSIVETGWLGSTSDSNQKLALGAWYYDRKSEALSKDQSPAHNQGAYLLLNSNLYGDMSGFARYGVATSELNPMNDSLEVGLHLPLPPLGIRDQEINLGYALAHAAESDAADGFAHKSESVVELNYSIAILEKLRLVPDFQYIAHPGFGQAGQSAKVFTLRFVLNY